MELIDQLKTNMTGTVYEDMIDHVSPDNLSNLAWKNNRAWMGSKPMTSVSYQANWELAALWVCNVPVDVEEHKMKYTYSVCFLD